MLMFPTVPSFVQRGTVIGEQKEILEGMIFCSAATILVEVDKVPEPKEEICPAVLLLTLAGLISSSM